MSVGLGNSDSMKKKWEIPIITFDVDWAPDFIIEEIKEVLADNKIKSTWFITNDSPILKELKNQDKLNSSQISFPFFPSRIIS